MPQDFIVPNGPDYLYSADTFVQSGMPIFHGPAEVKLHVAMGRELIESLIKQTIVLYKVDATNTESNFYGEAKIKNFKPPVTLAARVQIADEDASFIGGVRQVKRGSLITHVYNEHLVERGASDVKVGDFILFEGKYYEIYDHGPNDDENQRRLGVDAEFYRTLVASYIESPVFSGK